MLLTDELFSRIIKNLKEGKSIHKEVEDVLNAIENDESVAKLFLLSFLDKIKKSDNFNKEIMAVIDTYLNGSIELDNLSFKLFNEGKKGYSDYDELSDESLILHDNIKRGNDDYIYSYNSSQFHHLLNDESYFEKMLRVLFEFTRGDEKHIRGVCFDYCLFLCALDIMKNGRTNFLVVNSIDMNRQINFIIIKNSEPYTLFDPFYGIYSDLKNYKVNGIVSVKVLNGKDLTTTKNVVTDEETSYVSRLRSLINNVTRRGA